MEYDEPSALTDYIWEYCSAVFSKFEKDVWRVDHHKFLEVEGRRWIDALERAKADHEEIKLHTKRFKRLLGWFVRDEYALQVLDVAFGSAETFKSLKIAIRDRVLIKHPELIIRCLRCDRVLRTPKAKQCCWCLADWH